MNWKLHSILVRPSLRLLFFASIPILVLLLTGCETDAERYRREDAALRERIEAIPSGQPVSEADANFLASTYWRRFRSSSCGLVYPVSDNGQSWKAHVVAGYIPIDEPSIFIDKLTGAISWKQGPTITNWSELSRFR